MKTIMLLAVMAVGGVAQLAAQVELISVEKVADYNQTGDGTVTLRPYVGGTPPPSSPYQFRIDVEGNNISGIDAPTFTIPGGTYALYTDGSNHGKLFASDGEWGRTFYFPTKYNATGGPPDGSSEGGLDGLFHNGTYSVTVDSGTVNLNLGGAADADAYPSNAPLATVSAGTWAGGSSNILYLPVDQALTITTGTFSNFYDSGYLNHIGFYISSNGSDLVDMGSFSDDTLFPGASTEAVLSHTFDAFSLTSGQSYYVEIEYNVAVDTSDEIDGVTAVALFTARTQFVIQAISAVPEPSTYAAILGGLALVGVVMVRRRRLAAA